MDFDDQYLRMNNWLIIVMLGITCSLYAMPILIANHDEIRNGWKKWVDHDHNDGFLVKLVGKSLRETAMVHA